MKLLFAAVAMSMGHVTQWPDDGTRYTMSLAMRRELGLGFPDHIWPGGPFILNGLAMRLFENPAVAVRALGLAFSALGVLAAGWLAKEASGRNAAAAATAILVAALPMHTWLGIGAMTEVPCAAFMCASLAAALAGVRRWTDVPRCGAALLAASGFAATCACAWRYEGWMFAAALGASAMATLAGAARAPGSPWRRRGFLAAVGAAVAIAGLFPAAWIASSWMKLGSPLGFFGNQVGMNYEGNKETFLRNLLHYPRGMHWQMGALWGLVFAGLALALRDWRGRLAAAAMVGFLAVFAAITAVKGTGPSIERYVIAPIVFAFVFGGVAVGEIVAHLRAAAGRRALSWAGIAAFAAVAAGLCHRALDRHDYKWWGFRTESFFAGALLQQEFHEPQLLPGLARGGRAVLWSPEDPNNIHLEHIMLMVGRPERFWRWRAPEPPPELAAEPNLSAAVFADALPPMPPDMEMVGRMGRLSVWTRKANAAE